MTTLIAVFFISMLLSLILTPQVEKLARRYRIEDKPEERKVHKQVTPRAGGIAIYLSFFIPFLCIFFYYGKILEAQEADHRIITLIAGASLAFLLGLLDDIRGGLDARLKFAAQIVIALIACSGGIGIRHISLFDTLTFDLGLFSVPVTVFWILVVINAVNLIDGLDGLAAGITLFVSLVLLVICINTGRIEVALGLAALAGSTLGFLRYNFNPASIFMGDSGSYFLGYMLAGLSIMGSLKGTATVAVLIPVIALGLPLTEVFFSPIRRFVVGKGIFAPDRNHLHHRLLELGFTHRNAVLILYGVTLLAGALAIYTVHAKSDRIALILFIIGATVITGIRKLGYANYLTMHRVQGWVGDICDELGISRTRRDFLNLQIEISQSRDINTLWQNITVALESMEFDMAEMKLDLTPLRKNLCRTFEKFGLDPSEMNVETMLPTAGNDKNQRRMVWQRNGFNTNGETFCRECFLKMELPLVGENGEVFGFMWLIKDLKRNAISYHTLRRVEHFRRTVLGSLHNVFEC